MNFDLHQADPVCVALERSEVWTHPSGTRTRTVQRKHGPSHRDERSRFYWPQWGRRRHQRFWARRRSAVSAPAAWIWGGGSNSVFLKSSIWPSLTGATQTPRVSLSSSQWILSHRFQRRRCSSSSHSQAGGSSTWCPYGLASGGAERDLRPCSTQPVHSNKEHFVGVFAGVICGRSRRFVCRLTQTTRRMSDLRIAGWSIRWELAGQQNRLQQLPAFRTVSLILLHLNDMNSSRFSWAALTPFISVYTFKFPIFLKTWQICLATFTQ